MIDITDSYQTITVITFTIAMMMAEAEKLLQINISFKIIIPFSIAKLLSSLADLN